MDPTGIYEDLREKIIWLEHAPESTLNLSDLAASFGVSRTPVTIALTRLDAEGWVVRHGSHFVVSPLSLSRIREITEIRSVLEIQANVWAMHRMSPEGLSELKDLLQEIRHVKGNAARTLFELDRRFHRIVWRETRNVQLVELLERLLSHYFRFWLSSLKAVEPEPFFFETLEIIQAIEIKDEMSLRAASSRHIKVSLDHIMELF